MKLPKSKLVAGLVLLSLLILSCLYFYLYKNLGTVPALEEQPDNAIKEEPRPILEEPVVYRLISINKKDGDLFAVPDDVVFEISPSVERTELLLKNSSGDILYEGGVDASKGTVTIYPNGRVVEGATGSLTIKGIKNGKTVIEDEKKVRF